MNVKSMPWKTGLIGLSLVGILAACVVGGGGYDGAVGVGYVGGYYAPGGYDYGGWGRGYHVAPPRGGDRRGDAGGHAGHGAPSIPNRSHQR
jgi:hypothetical protein